MNKKIQKLREEQERNEAKITALKERNKDIERKVAEEENIEIRAVLRSHNITLDELIALASAKQAAEKSDPADEYEPYAEEAIDDVEEDEIDDEDDE